MTRTHTPDWPALDPYAHLLGDYGKCKCGAGQTWYPADPAALIAEAEADKQTRAGYKYNPEILSLRIRQGLRVGDGCSLRGAVAEYLGASQIEISAPGKPNITKTISDRDAAVMLMMLAKGEARISETFSR